MAVRTHTPVRTCRVCRHQAAQHELERWVIRDGGLVLDNEKLYGGRGFYSCRSGCSTQIHASLKNLMHSSRGARV